MEVFIEKGPSTGERSAPNGQRTRLSNGDDAWFAKDRDRSRLQINQARPTLSAVGRVASRVRTSGISKISTLLQNGKEEVENISASPWGVGEAAMARSQSTSVLARGLAKSTSTMRMKPSLERSESTVHMKSPLAKSESSMNMKSPIQRSKNTNQTNSALSRSGNIARSDSLKRKNSSDVLEMSSPMSTDHAESPTVESSPNSLPTDDKASGQGHPGIEGMTDAASKIPKIGLSKKHGRLSDAGRAGTPDSPLYGRAMKRGEGRLRQRDSAKMLERLGSANVKSKFHFRPSLLIESESPAACAKEKDDSFQCSLEKDESKASEASFVEPPKAQDGQKRKDSGNMSVSKVNFVSSPEVDHELERMESLVTCEVEKSSIFTFISMSRSKSRQENPARKNKNERQRAFLGLSRSRSQAQKPPLLAEQPASKDEAELVTTRKHSSYRSSGARGEPPLEHVPGPVKQKKVGWFNLRKTEATGERPGGVKGRTKSRKLNGPVEKDRGLNGDLTGAKQGRKRGEESRNVVKGSRFGRRGLIGGGLWSSGTQEQVSVGDEVTDEAIRSSDEEKEESSGKVRSLAYDDFIVYQTKGGRKGKTKP